MATKKVGQLIFPLPSVSVIGSGILDPGFEIRDPVSGIRYPGSGIRDG